MIIDKMANRDKDFRYMAVSDLLAELQKEVFKMDPDQERKLVTQIFKLLTDAAGDVQGLAVKCLPLLIYKTSQVDMIVDGLFQMVEKGKDEDRDIASIGLKTVLADGQPSAGAAVGRLTPRLVSGIGGAKTEVTVCCLEILHEVLLRFPSLVTSDLATIKAKLLPELDSPRPATRKRTVTCVGALCGSLSDEDFSSVVAYLLDQLEASAAKEDAAATATYAQALCAVARSAGFRLGPNLERLVPAMLRTAEAALVLGEGGTDVAEHCLLAGEAVVLRCPGDATPYVGDLVGLALRALKHDPNYADGDDEDEDPEAMEDGDEEEDQDGDEDDGDGEYSDDDDMSWKVRRAATKLLSAVMAAKADCVAELFPRLCPALLARFGEREESVRADVFATARLLVVTAAGPGAAQEVKALLRSNLPRIVAALRPQVRSRSPKTRQGAFVVARELALATGPDLAPHLGVFLPAVCKALTDRQAPSALRLDVLGFLRAALDTSPADAVRPHMQGL
eukprot:CAMPEP_0206012078 /NCGR_PEP_ID=MMETSP1464-20131121/14229_1 /ASSEMBLY_ACC=CAM_ASM_001124 /TAXON_ID=119497 /ORGANISM="Exanthemachrysis gayraliae, Strain RCC1523" /LENGTH=506 /DNA_ID=CAMNT_0053385755 /DNA_START=34 /DNA_END=1551 /DNA_ORIENTATION=+